MKAYAAQWNISTVSISGLKQDPGRSLDTDTEFHFTLEAE